MREYEESNPPNRPADSKERALEKPAPVSRFWACFFAVVFPIAGFFWTHKMKKNIKWFVLIILNIVSQSVYFAISFEVWIIVVVIGCIIIIYIMYKWTGEYNLVNFGYKGNGEWENADSRDRSPVDF